jgi:tetratricopeptide (TPR) repeat protein
MEYQDRKQYEKAIQLYSEILGYNEDGHQGIRYLLLECFLALKDYEAAGKLLKKHKEDWGIKFVYGRLLLAIIDNEKDILESLLADALKRNKFVPDEITKSKHIAPPPFRISEEPYLDAGIPIGSIQEAYEYWRNNKTILSDKRVQVFFTERK